MRAQNEKGMGTKMKKDVIYVKAEQEVAVSNKKVFLEDAVKLYGEDKQLIKELNRQILLTVKGEVQVSYMVSILKVIELIQKQAPGVYVENLGEIDFIIEYKPPGKKSKAWEYAKGAFISVTAFIGAAFSIMTFNADGNVTDIFKKSYELMLISPSQGHHVVEIAYSVGLAAGILIFYNHFAKKKLPEDPTPIQVEMRTYEKDVNNARIQTASREGKTIDAD